MSKLSTEFLYELKSILGVDSKSIAFITHEKPNNSIYIEYVNNAGKMVHKRIPCGHSVLKMDLLVRAVRKQLQLFGTEYMQVFGMEYLKSRKDESGRIELIVEYDGVNYSACGQEMWDGYNINYLYGYPNTFSLTEVMKLCAIARRFNEPVQLIDFHRVPLCEWAVRKGQHVMKSANGILETVNPGGYVQTWESEKVGHYFDT